MNQMGGVVLSVDAHLSAHHQNTTPPRVSSAMTLASRVSGSPPRGGAPLGGESDASSRAVIDIHLRRRSRPSRTSASAAAAVCLVAVLLALGSPGGADAKVCIEQRSLVHSGGGFGWDGPGSLSESRRHGLF